MEAALSTLVWISAFIFGYVIGLLTGALLVTIAMAVFKRERFFGIPVEVREPDAKEKQE